MRIITRPKGKLSIETFSTLLNNFGAQLQYLTLYLQGEPLMNRDFCEMVKIARARNIFVFTSTNAHHITPQTAKEICLSGLNHILISLDGTTQETYETYRKGGSFDTVTEGIRNLIHARNELKTCNPFIEIQFIIFRHNQHQINDIKLLSKQLMVDRLSFKSAQIYELNEAEKFVPQQSTKVRYQKNQSGHWSLKKLPDNRCKRLWTTSSITWDGKMIPCCYDKNAQFEMGLPATQSIAELWNSQKINAFRKTVLKNQSSIEMCSNCGDRF
jgi:radical SAM protein with 4Fe4S-binding SPASM domain